MQVQLNYAVKSNGKIIAAFSNPVDRDSFLMECEDNFPDVDFEAVDGSYTLRC